MFDSFRKMEKTRKRNIPGSPVSALPLTDPFADQRKRKTNGTIPTILGNVTEKFGG